MITRKRSRRYLEEWASAIWDGVTWDVEAGTHLQGSPHETHDADSHPSGEPRTEVLSVVVWGTRLETEPEGTLKLDLDASSCPNCWVGAG